MTWPMCARVRTRQAMNRARDAIRMQEAGEKQNSHDLVNNDMCKLEQRRANHGCLRCTD